MKPITIWLCWTKQKNGSHEWEHNHIEDGHVEGDFPKPVVDVPGQKGWKNFKWSKMHAYLDDKGVVQLSANGDVA